MDPQGASLTGANGTFNYLIKLVTDVPETRAMYFRRLRTIMDTYLNGWVRSMPTSLRHQAPVARKWYMSYAQRLHMWAHILNPFVVIDSARQSHPASHI